MNINGNNDQDPVEVIGEALTKILVDYYPFFGRLRNVDNDKIIMGCTGEGVVLVEAKADISLEYLGDLSSPILRALDVINNSQASNHLTDSPLLLCWVGIFGFQLVRRNQFIMAGKTANLRVFLKKC